MVPSALDEIRRTQHGYATKARLLFLSGALCALTPLAVSSARILSRGTEWQHRFTWLSPWAWLLYFAGVCAFQCGFRARRYRQAADILAGAVVRLEVNPALPDDFRKGIEAKVEQVLHARWRGRRKVAA